MMNIKETIDQINYVMEEVEDTPEKYRQLHELAWRLVNISRPESFAHMGDFYDEKEQAMKEMLSGYIIEEKKDE